jgi:hypothetical protein
MTWANPPPAVVALRDMLATTGTAGATAGLVTAKYHYPSADPNVDALPYAVISEESSSRRQFAEPGTQGLPSGSLTVTVYAALTAGEMETLGRAMAADMMTTIGLPGLDAGAGLCSDPTPEMLSSGLTYRTIDINVSYGIN